MNVSSLVFGSLGTLTETSHLHHRAFNDTFEAEGLPWRWDLPTYQELLHVVGGAARLEHYSRQVEDGPRLSGAEAAALQARKTERYAELVRSEPVELRPGVERLLAEAAAAGVALGLATGTSQDNLEASIDATGRRITLDTFDAYTLRADDLAPKPAPDIHRACMARLGADPAATIAIEDTEDGVASAAAAGSLVVATPGDYAADHDFARAAAVVSCLGDQDRPASLLSDGPELTDKIVTLDWLRSLPR